MKTINLRINHIAEHFFAGNNVKFAVAVCSSEANVRNYRKLTVPKVEFIVKTCDLLNISESWILAGKGEMLRIKEKFDELKEPPTTNGKSIEKKLIEMQEEKIAELKEKLKLCENEKKLLENNKSNV